MQLISIFIGHNDFCSEICAVPSPWSIVENHKIELVKTLRILRDNLPRTFIAIQLPPHLKELVASRKGRNSLKCYVTTLIECSCLFALQFQDRRQEYYKVIRRYDLNYEFSKLFKHYWHYYANESNKIALLTYSSILLVRLNICLFLMLEIFPTNILSLSKKNNCQEKNYRNNGSTRSRNFLFGGLGDPL